MALYPEGSKDGRNKHYVRSYVAILSVLFISSQFRWSSGNRTRFCNYENSVTRFSSFPVMSCNGKSKSRFISSQYAVGKLLGVHKPVVQLSDIMEDLTEPERKKYQAQLDKYKRERRTDTETGQGHREAGETGQDFGLDMNNPTVVLLKSGSNVIFTVGNTSTPALSLDGDRRSAPDFDILESTLAMEPSDQVATSSMQLAGEFKAGKHVYFQNALNFKPRSEPATIFRPWLDEDERRTVLQIESSGSQSPGGSKIAPICPLAPIDQAQDTLGCTDFTDMDCGAIINELIDDWDAPEYVRAELERDLLHGTPGPLAVFDLLPEDFLPHDDMGPVNTLNPAEMTRENIPEPMDVDTIEIATSPRGQVQEKSGEIEREEAFELAEELVLDDVVKSMRRDPDGRKTREDANISQVLRKDPQEFVQIVKNLNPFLEDSPKNRVLQSTLSDLNRNARDQSNELLTFNSKGVDLTNELLTLKQNPGNQNNELQISNPNAGDQAIQLQTSESISNEHSDGPGTYPVSSPYSPGPSQVTTITMAVVLKTPEDEQLQYNMERSLKKAKKNAGDDKERKMKIDVELRKLKRLKASREGAPSDLPPLKLSRS